MTIEDVFHSIVHPPALIDTVSEVSDNGLFNAYSQMGINDTELLVVMEEILINAQEHGKKDIQLFMGHQLDFYFFACQDKGSGIHKTLPKNPALADLSKAKTGALLRAACEEHITGTGVLGRGLGLYLLSDFCEKRKAEFLIASDFAILIKNHNIFMQKEMDIDIPGTIICLKWRFYAK